MPLPEGPLFALTPRVGPDSDMATLKAFARTADTAGFGLLMLGGAQPELAFEPLIAATALGALTRRIHISAAVSTDLGEPFTLARGFTAFDHLSRGRSAWRVTFAEDQARAREFVQVTCALWDSWDADAIVHDKANARHSDPDKVRRIDHEGPHFHVRGPLNSPRPRQGRPPIVLDAAADPDWIAETADLVLADCGDADTARALAGRLRAAASERQRGLRVLLRATPEEAQARREWAAAGACEGLDIHAPLTCDLAGLARALELGA